MVWFGPEIAFDASIGNFTLEAITNSTIYPYALSLSQVTASHLKVVHLESSSIGAWSSNELQTLDLYERIPGELPHQLPPSNIYNDFIITDTKEQYSMLILPELIPFHWWKCSQICHLFHEPLAWGEHELSWFWSLKSSITGTMAVNDWCIWFSKVISQAMSKSIITQMANTEITENHTEPQMTSRAIIVFWW